MKPDAIEAACAVVTIIAVAWSFYIKTSIVDPLKVSIDALNKSLDRLENTQQKQDVSIGQLRDDLFKVSKEVGVTERDVQALHDRFDNVERDLSDLFKVVYGHTGDD